jgi:peptide/nickel transport system ATP-binding protein
LTTAAPPGAGSILEVRDLSVDIPVPDGMLHPVQGVSFDVGRGETFCIVGESGCGKSLTSLAIMDLLPRKATKSASRLNFGGQSLVGLSERQMSDIRGNKMAMIFQEPMTSLNPAFSIGNQLEEALLRHDKTASRRDARDRAMYLLERVGITAAKNRLTQYPHQLSGGLRQRVMIAMALMCGPDLIIADEPTTALDVTIQAQILYVLAELQDEFQMGLLLITHDLGVVARIATRIAVMYAGQIIETGTAKQIFGRPIHPYTQGLLDCIPVPGKTARGSELGSIPGIVPSLIGETLGCHFAERCPRAIEACHTTDLDLTPGDEPDHLYRCLLDASDSKVEFAEERVG